MKNKFLLSVLFGFIAFTGQSQKHLPSFKYSKEPAVLIGYLASENMQQDKDVSVSYTMKYNAGMGDARRSGKAVTDKDGCCRFGLHTGTTVECLVKIGDCTFPCYIVPGDTITFTLDMDRVKTDGLAQSLSFSGILADFNHDLVYAIEQGFDPNTIYLDIEMKRNMGNLADELPEVSVDGYFRYLDSTYHHVNELIDKDRKIGDEYREFAKAVNLYYYGSLIPFCAHSIRYAGVDTEEEYDALVERENSWLERYMRDDPWNAPSLCYIMWGTPDMFISSEIIQNVKLPEDYRQCYLASKYMKQIGQQLQLLSEAQIDSVRVYLPELGQDVLDYNNKLEQELAVINSQGQSRVCTLPDNKINTDDILSALLEPYRGRPVLIDLWETTCGPCRLAFKKMHEKKIELADRIHFVNVASERSDLAAWQRLVPGYIGDHYRLTEQQLQALHRQLPCDTNAIPTWVLINADGTIHHTFTGWRDLDTMMKELSPVLQ